MSTYANDRRVQALDHGYLVNDAWLVVEVGGSWYGYKAVDSPEPEGDGRGSTATADEKIRDYANDPR
jgi:hypothetical protein